MSDNLRQYRAIRAALIQGYPGEPTGRLVRHLTTLAAFISGIVASKSTQLPHIAMQVPDGQKPESRVKRFARWLDNERILEERYFLPYAEILLTHLALETLVLVMDGSVVGRGCVALMIHVLYKGRALPLAWRVRQGPKGHFPEELHIALVALMRACLPEGTQVVLLGDGEFDGTTLQETLNEAGWCYVCRTAQSTVATWDGETFRLDTLGACSKPGTLIALQEVKITRDAYGPVMVLSCWAKGYQEPGRSYRFGDWARPNNASKRPLTQASLRCKRWLKPSSLHRIPTPLKRCWMSHLHALSTIPLPSGSPNALYVA